MPSWIAWCWRPPAVCSLQPAAVSARERGCNCDPNGANTGGVEAPELLAMLTNIAVPTLLISNFDML